MAMVLYRNANQLAPFRFMRDWERELSNWLSEHTAQPYAWGPPVDLRETEDAYHIEIELPGMRREDIDISVMGSTLTVRGERKHAHPDNGYRLQERRHGRFERSFRIPGGFDDGKVAAQYENGILYLTLPKPEEQKPRRIEVQMG